MEYNYTRRNLEDGTLDIKLTLSGEGREKELILKSFGLLLDMMEPKHLYNGDTDQYSKNIEELLLMIVDKIGEDYLYHFPMFDSIITYDEENEERIVSIEAKIKALSMITEDLKKRNNLS